MTTLMILMTVACALCLMALAMTLWNLKFYNQPTDEEANRAFTALQPGEPLVSVCIPARNEESNIEACVRSALSSTVSDIEVLIYNDHSTDRTGEIVQRLGHEDARVRTPTVVDLPSGWNGKQFACQQMGLSARGRWLLFTDADVRLEPKAISATLARASSLRADLISGIPLERTHTLGEALVIPLIHFILLSYLPMVRMRTTPDPAASAGCGQYLFVRREAYEKAGRHEAFKASMHDGIMMPRTLRRAGFRTDLFDPTELVSCRMYRGFTQTWRGFAKNAYEGLGSIVLLLFVTVVHLLGHVLPWIVLALAALGFVGDVPAVGLAAFACVIALSHRFFMALRFQQRFIGAALHPLGIVLMTAIQWHSFVLHMLGKRTWKGRDTNGRELAVPAMAQAGTTEHAAHG